MDFIFYFGEVFTFTSMLLLIGGTIGGLIMGATPGLSPTMTVALLIPFTFNMTPVHGLILLGAAYTSTVAGGAVSAILLKIPGAPANIATTLDGNAMARPKISVVCDFVHMVLMEFLLRSFFVRCVLMMPSD